MYSRILGLIALMSIGVAHAVVAAELVVLTPMTTGTEVVMRAGPKGEKPAPILRRAPDNAVTKSVLREATRGSIKFMLDLDEYAQRISGAKTAPTYLSMSREAGGFARRNFWLAVGDKFVWHTDPYVDLAVDNQSIADGSFEEEFAHEMGHVLLHRVLPRFPSGMSRAPHSSLAVTDYPTAFDEGFAIHFQGLARQITTNPQLQAYDDGFAFKPFVAYWASDLDRAFRLRGMRDDLFIHLQLPVALQVGDATSLFDLTHFKNGQQMMASEGVIATLFYHLQLRVPDKPEDLLNRYKSLLHSLRALNSERIQSGTPIFLNLVQAHIQRVPQARNAWVGTVLDLTYGATASTSVIRGMTNLSALGQEGKRDEYVAALKRSRATLATLTANVVRDPKRLSAALGSELWLGVKRKDGDVETINLNTAEQTGLTDVLGFETGAVNLLLADRATGGPFKDVADFATRRGLSADVANRLAAAQALAHLVGDYDRQN